MTDSATSVSRSASSGQSEPRMPRILQQIEEYADEHPEAQAYYLSTEDDARDLLVAIMSTLRITMQNSTLSRQEKEEIGRHAMSYHEAIQSGECLNFVRLLTEDDELAIYGLTLKVSPVLIQ